MNQPIRTLEEKAISSMNYFFLRMIAGRETESIILDELEGFVECLDNEADRLKPEVKRQITNEIEEGDYFADKTALEVKTMLDDGIKRLTGQLTNNAPRLTALYLSLIPNGIVLLSTGDILEGAKSGKFKHGDEFKMNNGFTDYDARLSNENDAYQLTEIELGFLLKPENPNKLWWKVSGANEVEAQ